MDLALPIIHYAARETWHREPYYYDNRNRSGPGILVIQKTIRGRAFLERGGTRHQVLPGQAMLFFHGEHSAYGLPPDFVDPYENAYLCLRGGLAEPLFHNLVARFGPILPLPENTPPGHLFEEAVQSRIDQSFRDRYDEAETVVRLLLEMHRELSGSSQRLDPGQLLHEEIQNYFQRPLSLKEFAQRHQVSREHLSRLFQRHYREPPAAFLRRIRLNRARLLLESTDLPVGRVGLLCGYPDPNVFTRAFRRFHGLPPRAMRQ